MSFETLEQDAPLTEAPGRYAAFDHTFTDAWTREERTFSFRFAKPTSVQIKQLQKTASRDSSQASMNLLVQTVHPDEKQSFMAAVKDYPGLVTTYAGALMKAVGLADLGN